MIVRAIPQNSPKAGQAWRWWRAAVVRFLPPYEDCLRDPAYDSMFSGR